MQPVRGEKPMCREESVRGKKSLRGQESVQSLRRIESLQPLRGRRRAPRTVHGGNRRGL